ncbi:unnamed protein product [Cylindrotheca closterium]|uniref:Uncharacterized protein n=1 Tax=Cylindrotheca closterium TaxID=2856 RepID=A0AAD2CIW4_9STRA|nr:unnamed protein product [Cylindrotheca closterium]
MSETSFENDRRQSNSMNVEYHQHHTAIEHPRDHSNLGRILQPALESFSGLSTISRDTLQKNLQPIMNALERLDAQLLLDLKSVKVGEGPRLNDSQSCAAIYDDIQPPMNHHSVVNTSSCVRYVHISEIPDQYSIGIFVFAPYGRIPLHDHPDMCVLSRVLYGDLERRSLDLARLDEDVMDHSKSGRRNWMSNFFGRENNTTQQALPKGTKRAFKNHVDHLKAPQVTALFPYEGNLHEFVAGPNGAAVLDVLLPPYDNTQNRDCTFYEIRETDPGRKPSGKEPCYVVPTGQPEDFHCISGRYGDLGEDDHQDMDFSV